MEIWVAGRDNGSETCFHHNIYYIDEVPDKDDCDEEETCNIQIEADLSPNYPFVVFVVM
jgi:hypothetical protein